MKVYKRSLNILKLLEKKSHFLFGARSTGKSTLIGSQLKGAKVYDLLSSNEYRRLLKDPSLLREEVVTFDGFIVIDEIQKLPLLLDEVHWIIENQKKIFLLTGSSSRKLKQGGANLLAGRAWWTHLYPLTSHEITDFDLIRYLNRGGLPQVYQSKFYKKELDNYISLYIREEIKAEALTRRVENFVEFLDLIALSNGEEINISNFANDCGVSTTTIKSYLSILVDTQTGFFVHAFTKSKKRKAISRSKFYLFDVGVTGYIAQRGEVKERSELFGKAFEHFIAMELRAYLSYKEKDFELNYWRTTSQMEVDFIVGSCAIEVKGAHQVQKKHLKGLHALKEERLPLNRYILVSLDTNKRLKDDGIEILPYMDFLSLLWKGKIL